MGAACRPGGARDCDDGDTCTRDSCEARAGCVHAPVQGHDAVACCLPKVALDCSVKKIRRRLAKQWGRAAHALVAAVRTPAPRREKRLQRALDRLQALRRRCPDGPPPPDCFNQGV
jgi:hypothetical protein